MKTTPIALDLIRIDDEIQPRVILNQDALDDYSQLYREAKANGEKHPFPPLRLFDDNGTMWLSRGFHRHAAAQEAGFASLECEVIKGDWWDAYLDARQDVDAESCAVRRTKADRKKIIAGFLADERSKKWNQQQIADKAGCSLSTVRRLCRELKLAEPPSIKPKKNKGKTNAPTYIVSPTTGHIVQRTSSKNAGPTKSSGRPSGTGVRGKIEDHAEHAEKIAGLSQSKAVVSVTSKATRAECERLSEFPVKEQQKIAKRVLDGEKGLGMAILAHVKDKSKKPKLSAKIQEALDDTWFRDAEKALKKLAKEAKRKLQRTPWFRLDLAPMVLGMEEAASAIGDCQAKVACPECKGVKSSECGWCRNSGFMPAWAYNDWKAKQR